MATPTFILPSAPTYTEGFVNGLNVYPNPTNFVANQVPFTRATTATRTNAAGLIELTPYNLLTYSEQFENAAWTKNNSSIAANIITAPNGTLTADKLVEDTSNAVHNVLFSLTPTITTYSISFYAKKAERNFAAFYFGGASWGGQGFIVNLTTGEVTTNTTGATPIITLLPDGWVKIEASRAAATAIQIQFQVFTALNASTISYTGDGASGIYIWGAQLVEGTAALPYLLTETRLNRPRVDFSLGGCPNLLLEPQRTNLSLFSEQFDNAWWLKTASITANSTISPSGIQNADTFTDSSAVSYLDVRTSAITITANATYTASFFIKKTTGALTNYAGVGFILTGTVQRTDFGIINTTTGQVVRDAASSINVATYSSQSYNDYWRVIVTFTDNQSNTNCSMYLYPAISTNGTSISPTAQGSNIFWGAQFELGAYSTSYIPTTSASVTRNSDVISRSNIFTNGYITSAGGTWFIDLRNNLSLIRDVFSWGINLSTLSTGGENGFSIRLNGNSISQRLSINKLISNTETFLLTTTANTSKIAIKWNGTTSDVFVNGVKVVTATAFTITNMQFLNLFAGDVPKYINSMSLYPTPLSDTELINLTTL
jgi:hypothetical protein